MPKRSTVPVVEDEVLLRLNTVDELTDYGFDVVEAGNAREAINIFKSGGRFECLFTDVDMPRGVDGMRLAAIIRDRWPPIKLILVSGHIQDPGDQIPAETVFFAKPYREEQIVEAIRQMLN